MRPKDKFGDRMKLYENLECGRRLMPLLPILARVDGRCFHAFTRGMERPFDTRFQAAMVATAMALARETNACMVYTQSDEITLVWQPLTSRSPGWFDGRVCKMISQLGAQATLAFYRAIMATMPEYADRLPTFDARVWQVPNAAEAANVLLWREQDATKNSISMAASSVYSDKELLHKHGENKQEMLFQKGINWNDYPVSFKRGIYIQRRWIMRTFTDAELTCLPPQHAARKDPMLVVVRSEWQELEMPIFSTVLNREDVIFTGATPFVATSSAVSPAGGPDE